MDPRGSNSIEPGHLPRLLRAAPGIHDEAKPLRCDNRFLKSRAKRPSSLKGLSSTVWLVRCNNCKRGLDTSQSGRPSPPFSTIRSWYLCASERMARATATRSAFVGGRLDPIPG